jgi:hypothetical protein
MRSTTANGTMAAIGKMLESIASFRTCRSFLERRHPFSVSDLLLSKSFVLSHLSIRSLCLCVSVSLWLFFVV